MPWWSAPLWLARLEREDNIIAILGVDSRSNLWFTTGASAAGAFFWHAAERHWERGEL
jgi:hypothetical protein